MDSKDREVNELKTWAIRQLLYVIDSKTFSGFYSTTITTTHMQSRI